MIENLFWIGSLFMLWGNAIYIKDTLKGRTQPNRVTFFMWILAPVIATTAALSNGVSWAVFPVFMAGFMPFLVFLASFVNPKAYWKLHNFDFICGGVSVMALILWGVTKNPNVAIMFAILSDGLAAIPTIIKAYKFPETESGEAYIAGILSVTTGFLALKIFSFAELAFPIYLLILYSSITFSIYRKKLGF